MLLYRELKRRNVFRVAITYLALAWLVTEVAGTLFPAFGIPDWGVRFLVIVFALGFVPALIISWIYELTSEGLKREKDVVRDTSITHLTAKRLDGFTIGLIVVALTFILVDRLWLSPRHAEQLAAPSEVVSGHVRTSGPESAEPHYPPNSIAVLPFVNMSDDAGNEYFSDGISEELLNVLAKVPGLRVIARTSSFAYKGKDVKIADIARELNVSHVLEGSVRKSGNRVRITTQLIHAADSSHLWSETYDRTLDDIFAIQDEIASEVVQQLKITLLGQAPKTPEVDPKAFALFLQGRYFTNLGSAEGYSKAVEVLEQALTIDPVYAPAWAELGRTFNNQTTQRLLPREEGFTKALESLDKAISLDPGNAIAYSRKGWTTMAYKGDLVTATGLLQQALALEPGNVIVLANAADLVKALGRLDEAIALEEQALLRDPLDPTQYINLGGAYIEAKRYDEAEAMFRKAMLLSPNRIGVRAMLGRVLLLKNQPEAAMDALEGEPFEPLKLAGLVLGHHALGNAVESDAALEILVAKYAETTAPLIGLVYASLGELEIALEWLVKAYEQEGPRVLLNAMKSPELESLRSDPRWEQLLTRAGVSEQQLAAIPFEVVLPD